MPSSTTQAQDKNFCDLLIKELSIESIPADWVLAWVAETFGPEDIFTDKELDDWAVNSGYKRED